MESISGDGYSKETGKWSRSLVSLRNSMYDKCEASNSFSVADSEKLES
jgi:hypothetical protein